MKWSIFVSLICIDVSIIILIFYFSKLFKIMEIYYESLIRHTISESDSIVHAVRLELLEIKVELDDIKKLYTPDEQKEIQPTTRKKQSDAMKKYWKQKKRDRVIPLIEKDSKRSRLLLETENKDF